MIKVILTLLLVCQFTSQSIAANTSCPNVNADYSINILHLLLENENAQLFLDELGLQGLSSEEFVILSDPGDSVKCAEIESKGFYTDISFISVAKTFYSVGDRYLAVVQFLYDDSNATENGVLTLKSGPSGAIAVYDEQFEILESAIIL